MSTTCKKCGAELMGFILGTPKWKCGSYIRRSDDKFIQSAECKRSEAKGKA